MTMRFLPTVALSVMLIAPGLAMAEDSTAPTKRDRFELWNECKPIGLIVENLPNHAAEISLTRERIETLVRSRLRAARIYRAGDFSPYFYVNVNMFGRAFSIELNLTKFLTDRISGEKGNAATWIKGSVGIHGRNAGYILQNVSEFTDKFIDEYLRVNVEACNSK